MSAESHLQAHWWSGKIAFLTIFTFLHCIPAPSCTSRDTWTLLTQHSLRINWKAFLSYHQPSFLYDLDTIPIDITDMSKLETSYRKVVTTFNVWGPECVPSALVYLTMGVLPVSAQRDIDATLSRTVVCLWWRGAKCEEIVNYNLASFSNKFGGWSGLVRKTALVYGLPDQLEYMQNP